MDIYKVIYESLEDGDLYGVSLVDTPANDKMFLTLSEQKSIKLQQIDPLKKLCTGIVLMPEQKIYREFEDGTPFLLMFDAPTIERFSQDFLDKGYQKNTSYNHDHSNWLDGTCIVESWIVEDPANDKLNALGFSDFPKGTWAITMKLNDSQWSEYIESGKAKGFSIDSFVKFEKINLNKIEPTMKKTSFLTKLVNLFSEGNVTLMDVDSSIGMLTADSLEIGAMVYNADMQPLVDAEFDFEGMTYSTDMNGAIDEVSAIEEENEGEPATDPTLMEAIDPELVNALSDDALKIQEEANKELEQVDVEALKATIEDLTKKVNDLMEAQAALTATNDTLLEENTNLKALEASVKIKANGNVLMNTTKNEKESALTAISRITKKIK